jgi:hypothetical protein
MRKGVKYILVLLILSIALAAPGQCALKYFKAQHWITGTVESAAGGTPTAEGREIQLYFPADPLSVEVSTIGFSGPAKQEKQYMINAFAIPSDLFTWEVGTTLEVRSPIGLDAYGAGPASVETTGAGQDFAPLMVLEAAFLITSINPTSGSIETAVTLTGANFGGAQAPDAGVYFGGVSIEPAYMKMWTDAQIIFLVSAESIGVKDVSVEVGAITSNVVTFEVTSLVPSTLPAIWIINPLSGASETLVTLSGANFGISKGGSKLYFGGAEVTNESWSDSEITFLVTTETTVGQQGISVEVGGEFSNTVFFYVTSITPAVAPTITGIDPISGQIESAVTLTGSDFGSVQGLNEVYFEGVSLESQYITHWSDGLIIFRVTAESTGVKYVSVEASALRSNVVTFEVTSLTPSTAPSIFSINPYVGAVTTSVSLEGVNFGDTKAVDSYLMFDGVTIEPTSWSSKEITFVVPTNTTAGLRNIEVEVGGELSNAVGFFVTSTTFLRIYSVEFNGVLYNPFPGAVNLVSQRPILTADITVEGGTGSVSTVEVYLGEPPVLVTVTSESDPDWLLSNSATFEYTFAQDIPFGAQTIHLGAYTDSGEYALRSFNVTVVRRNAPVEVVGVPLAYPAPFRPMHGETVTIAYNLSADSNVTLYLYDISGQIVWTGKFRAGSVGGRMGYNGVQWNGGTDMGWVAANGIYVFKIISDGKQLSKGKLVILD